MSAQSVDIYGAADFLGVTVATVRRRINAGTFPKPEVEKGVEWWELAVLDRYQKALARKKARKRR